jgi:hypothetical protein
LRAAKVNNKGGNAMKVIIDDREHYGATAVALID